MLKCASSDIGGADQVGAHDFVEDLGGNVIEAAEGSDSGALRHDVDPTVPGGCAAENLLNALISADVARSDGNVLDSPRGVSMRRRDGPQLVILGAGTGAGAIEGTSAGVGMGAGAIKGAGTATSGAGTGAGTGAGSKTSDGAGIGAGTGAGGRISNGAGTGAGSGGVTKGAGAGACAGCAVCSRPSKEPFCPPAPCVSMGINICPRGDSMTAWGMLVMWLGMPFPRRKFEKVSVKLLQLCLKRS